MTRRRKGLQYMIFTQDSILDDCHLENMTREVFIKDCEKAVNTAEVHSDEWSTEDKVLVNEERNDNIRSGKLISTNSVIKIHNKEWRLKESYFKQTRSEWIEPESDDDDDDEDNNGDNNNDNNNSNDDNNVDSNNSNADKNDGTNEEQTDDNNGNLDVNEYQGSFYLEVPVDIRRRT
ncbi:hypothetical protein RclHR1_05970006 [Rhizophagus clarus]|uniref:Uncharacterized protein n=1 Tax=Rhizophagus clarus TaxID=94130 RepID=A0A2Z6SHF8_9GLOM|nr:hypothetical protein RclHR1_05970006 [Rhizophagus clarus]